MASAGLFALLDDQSACLEWLEARDVAGAARAYSNLRAISKSLAAMESSESTEFSLGAENAESAESNSASGLLDQIGAQLCDVSDPDRAINNLERLFSSHPQIPIGHLHGSGPFGLTSLMKLLSASQAVSDLMIQNWDCCLALQRDAGQLVTRDIVVQRLRSRLQEAEDSREAMKRIREFKHQETVRIAYADLIRGCRLEQVVEQISYLAESICEGAFAWSHQRIVRQWGEPISPGGEPDRYVILAMGKLGGTELNYSSDIDLVMVYDHDGATSGIGSDASVKANREFFDRLTRDIVRLLSESTAAGPAYRVDLRLRPEGSRGKVCCSRKSMLHYYDFQGRTWERQALIKAKPIAGDLSLGDELLQQLSPWIYHQNLNRADIAGIKALKRRIERKAINQGEELTNVKTGRGGIRDIEFVIQFLQLLNGGVLPEIRTPNTLKAILRLESAGCLTNAEATLLSQNYVWLRKLEHRLQLMYDLQTHTIPASETELRKTAVRMGYDGPDAFEEFKAELSETTESNRSMLNHLLHGAFGMTFGSLRDSGGHLAFADDEVAAEVDLILEPTPDQEMIDEVLRPFGFKNVGRAFENLMELAIERTPFLSTRRCHHFLAAIAPALLKEIAATPDPDATLVALAIVSDSLGAKGVLWELFSFNRPTLYLYVRMCATSDYLQGIIKSNPGMIDELMDSLQVEHLPSLEFLQELMGELVKGAEDIELIVHSFKNALHLRVGIRDVLGRDEIQDTHKVLADIAEVCLQTVVRHEYLKLLRRYTDLKTDDWKLLEEACPFVVLALGKLGGREPNYHSDLDLIFLFQRCDEFESHFLAEIQSNVATNNSVHPDRITSQFFFGQLAANVTKFIAHSQNFGRLYELDCRLRPTGKSGRLAISVEEFSHYFESGEGWLWERQALCKARPVFGSPQLRADSIGLVAKAIMGEPWRPTMAIEIMKTRLAMEQDCNSSNLKRGQGGTVDVEFSIQSLQLKYARDDSSILLPGTLAAIDRLIEKGFLEQAIGTSLANSYQLLRGVEARLRLINTTARHDLPENGVVLDKLAFLLNFSSAESLRERIDEARKSVRENFLELFSRLERAL